MTPSLPQQAPKVLQSGVGRGWTTLDAALVHVPRGRARAAGGERHVLGLHVGPPVRADCIVGGVRRCGVQKSGDICLVPATADGSWEDDADCRILRMSLPPALVDGVAEQLGRDAVALDPRPRFRDARIEAVAWAVKADLDAETPSDPLYIDLLTHALAVRLVEIAGERRAGAETTIGPRLSRRQSATLVDFIETHLDGTLRLDALAAIVGMSPTRLKASFRNSLGTPVHQYVLRRRVEHARDLIATTTLPASQIALAAGFAHQSHMTTTMRRILGLTPGMISRPNRGT